MALRDRNLSPISRAMAELAILFGFGGALIFALYSLGVNMQQLLIVITWLAGLIFFWSVMAVVDLILKHNRDKPEFVDMKRPGSRRVTKVPLAGSHPHVGVPKPKGDGHGRRAAR
jgi:fatty acid desaturase